MVYMIQQRLREYSLFKVGYAHNEKRFNAYSTHLGKYIKVATIATYGKTKHKLECEIHKELKEKGYQFIVDEHTGIKTEWFIVPIEEEKEFRQKNFLQFKCCKGRKIVPGD